MQTTTYGYKNPENGDTGATVFPAMNDNITRLDAHSHNGTDSALLGPASSPVTTQTVDSANWVATTNGNYRQAITISGSLLYDKIQITMKLASSGNQVFPKIEKVSSTSYYVYTNDSTSSFTAVYSS